jgi:hypothetical protein
MSTNATMNITNDPMATMKKMTKKTANPTGRAALFAKSATDPG